MKKLKGTMKNSNGLMQSMMLLALLFAGYMLGQIIFGICIGTQLAGQTRDVNAMLEILNNSPNLLRQGLFISHICTFLFPALAAAYIFSDNYKEYLHLETPFGGATAFWTVASMICVLPALNFIAEWNSQMTLPAALQQIEEILKQLEEQNARVLEMVLNTDKISVFIINILIVAVLAAVGEEFVFRGALQNIFVKTVHNHHLAIWCAAIIFSAIHLQFYGFIPRMLLGAYFGYLLYFTKTLWIPVLAHFTHNFIAVSATWFFRHDKQGAEIFDAYGTGETWWLAVAGAALFLFCATRLSTSNSLKI